MPAPIGGWLHSIVQGRETRVVTHDLLQQEPGVNFNEASVLAVGAIVL